MSKSYIEFEKKKGRVRKDSGYYLTVCAVRNKEGELGQYIIAAADEATLEAVWTRLNFPLLLDKSRIQRIGIFSEKDITNADS